jgi:dienelactone hydrolase
MMASPARAVVDVGGRRHDPAMPEILLFHHVQGLTPGVHAFADRLREAGHTVHVPDLFEGRRFDTIDAGIAHVQELGFDRVLREGRRIAEDLPAQLVYAGFSLGVMPAQLLAQTRPGAVGALLLHACVPVSEFGDAWPAGVPVQIHGMDGDPSFAGEGDLDAAQALVAANPDDAELFVYHGDGHLFADPSLPDYDEEAAELLTARVLEFLGRVAGPSSTA